MHRRLNQSLNLWLDWIMVAPLALLLAACQTPISMRDSTSDATPNALIHESSPYLRQHAYNPVDWKPWSEPVWEEARAKDKLVIVSIGYSACHWCHVMEHETFEDSAAAAFMNEHFVNIKVDREERPDVDGVYMTAVQLMTQRGGWPLNAICLPDGRPIYGGTYFPRERWLQALGSILKTRAEKPERVLEYAEQLTAGVQQAELVDVPPLKDAKAWGTPDAFGRADAQLLDDGIDRWRRLWDIRWGGNDGAPGETLDGSQCATKTCPGDSTQDCGGSLALLTYRFVCEDAQGRTVIETGMSDWSMPLRPPLVRGPQYADKHLNEPLDISDELVYWYN